MVDREAVRQQLGEISAFCALSLGLQNLTRRRVLAQKVDESVVAERHVSDGASCLGTLLARVYEDKHLILASLLECFFVCDFVHQLEALDRFLLRNANVLLLQRHRPVRVIKEEQPFLRVHSQESCHVLIVGESGRQTDHSNHLLGRLNLPNCSRHYRFEHRPSVVVQQVDFVNNHELDELRVGAIAALSGNDVPFLGSGDNHLCIRNLLLGQLLVACELLDGDSVLFEPLSEVEHHFLHEGFHGSHIDDLEGIEVD
mmetsp:Transcript_51147/g.84810  ORF Transcript_51147/g.84810 Transcript_51147/m.84810 type:complete len:257 (+) Transcript_51147:474-1244(+)